MNESTSAPGAITCDRAVFTSLPSRTGEGYRLVAWSGGVRPEERQELTRRAPSHGSLAGDGESGRGVIQFRLQSSGRVVCGLVRVKGAEHTRRGGGRVWTDFLLAEAAEAEAAGLHPQVLRASLAAATAEPPKAPLGTAPLERVVAANDGRAGAPFARSARAVAAAASAASLLLAGQACVVAAGANAADVFEDAFRMIPASLRAGIEACGGLRFSPSRGVRATFTDRIDQDTIRATRGHNVLTVDLEKNPPAPSGPLAPWLALTERWWNEQRGDDAVAVADRLGAGWTVHDIVRVSAICEAIDRGDERPERLDELFAERTAA